MQKNRGYDPAMMFCNYHLTTHRDYIGLGLGYNNGYFSMTIELFLLLIYPKYMTHSTVLMNSIG